MNKTTIQRIKVLGILGLPLLALAVALMVFTWGHNSADTTEAVTSGAPEMQLDITSGATECSGGKCSVPAGGSFTLVVDAVNIPAAGYILAQTYIDYGATGLTYKKNTDVGPPNGCNKEFVWPDLDSSTCLRGQLAPNTVNHGGLTALLPPQPKSNHKGVILAIDMNCTPGKSADHEIQLLASGHPLAGTDGALFVEPDGVTSHIPTVNTLTVNCINTPTPTPTLTNTPTPTDTPTPTPPDFPPVQKCYSGQGSSCVQQGNIWLTRQGDKIPPTTCLDQTVKGGVLNEVLGNAIASTDPKDPTDTILQQLAAFEFELNYDETKVCVNLNAGAEWDAAGAVCFIEDDKLSTPNAEGVARIGCVTPKKGHGIDDLAALATITLLPQPDVYSQAKPNQDNGVTVQINNVGCDLSDEQGHSIKIFSCEDADATIRYLEGDVEPDCVVDAVDAQAIGFRWGAEKGSTIYSEFMNLEPSGAQSDNDIDINDLQFVYGRFNSTCQDPHPDQDPINPKE